MKFLSSLALLALSSAAKQHASKTQEHASADAAHQADPVQQDDGGYTKQNGGYTQQDGGYAQQDTGYDYQPNVAYAAPAPKLCLGNCPAHAHCQHKATGACVAPVVSYAAPAFYGTAQSYTMPAAQQIQTGYRRLQGGYGQQEGGYAQEVPETYAEAPRAPVVRGSCPHGTIDLNCQSLSSTVTLWVGFALLFIPALYFWYATFSDPTYKDAAFWAKAKSPFDASTAAEKIQATQLSRAVSFAICFIASLAYLTMALGYGYTTRCCDGRNFYYARYVDWALTTPLMIWKIVERTSAGTHEKYFLIAMDILMIVAGLVGSLVCGSDKWAFFGFSMLCFCPVMYYICALRDQVRESDYFNSTYVRAVSITVIAWCCYPIVWILAEGTGTICAQAEAICYTVLDVIAKSVFGFILVSSSANYRDAAGHLVAGTSVL